MDTNNVITPSNVIYFYCLGKTQLSSFIRIFIETKKKLKSNVLLPCFAITLLELYGLLKLLPYWFCFKSVIEESRCREVLKLKEYKKSHLLVFIIKRLTDLNNSLFCILEFRLIVCSLWLESFTEGCFVRILTCAHVFYNTSIEQWIKIRTRKKARCLMCNVSLIKEDAQ